MFRNYLLIAWRNLRKNSLFSAIHIAGLALGVFACLSIYLYLAHQLRYDRFHVHGADIYRVNLATKWGEDEGKRGSTPPPVAGILMQELPEVMAATRLYSAPDVVLAGNQLFRETHIVATDTNFFRMFSFTLSQGDPKTALSQPNSVVLSEEMARKYFGNPQQAVGRTLQIGKKRTVFKVTGIVQSPPSHSHIRFDLLTSIQSYENVKFFDWSWVWTQVATYVRLRPGTEPSRLDAALARIVESHAPPAFERIGFPYAQFKQSNNYWKLYLQPLHRIWLHSQEVGNRVGDIGDVFFVYVFSCIGLFILVLACINFVNLSTAIATRRAREVGLRKSLGTSRGQLILQFLTESLLVCVIAIAAGFTLTQVFTHYAASMGLDGLSIHDLPPGQLLLLVGAFMVLLSLLGGFYPAFYLSSFDPVRALKGQGGQGASARYLRNGLVVFQFTLSVAMLLITQVANKQVQYLQEKNLGFTRERLLVVEHADQLANQKEYFKTLLLGLPSVASVTASTSTFPNFNRFTDTYQPKGGQVAEVKLTSIVADADLIPTMGLVLKSGRNFRKDNPADGNSVIINQMAARQMGWSNPVGQQLVYPGFPGDAKTFTIIGVISDFHSLPTHFRQEPVALFLPVSGHPTNEETYFLVRVQGDLPEALSNVEAAWGQSVKHWPFHYQWIDEEFKVAYRSYENTRWLFFCFAGMAIFISCLGLLGLALFSVNKRIKEIGIRKVLGAPVTRIILLLNGEFAQLIGISILLGAPLGYVLVDKWLQNFSSRTSINWLDWLLPGLIAFAIAVLTVSYISLKAARSNPIDSLRSE